LTTRLLSDLVVSAVSDVFWLIVPAVCGTVALVRTQSAVLKQDSNWTPSQILPVLLLIGTILTLLFAFLFRDTPTPLPISEPAQQYTDNPSSPSSSNPGQEPTATLLRESTPLFDQDYSNPTTAPWISPAVALPSLTTVLFTACFFRWWYEIVPNAASLVVRFLVPFLVGIPTASFFFTLLSLAYQRKVAPEAGSAVYWNFMGLVFAGSGGLYSVYLGMRAWMVLHVLNFVVLGFGGAVVLVNLVAVAMVKSGRERGVLAI